MAYESQGGTWREMITKETFVKALQLIQEQQEINHQFAKALDLVGDGHYVFGVNNKFYDAAMLVLKEAVNDKYDYISWWLYEGEPDYKVWSSDNTEEWNLTEPEALYGRTCNPGQRRSQAQISSMKPLLRHGQLTAQQNIKGRMPCIYFGLNLFCSQVAMRPPCVAIIERAKCLKLLI